MKDKVLEYLVNKYPVTVAPDINRNFTSSIQEIDNSDQMMNDYLYNTDIVFKFRDNGEYNDLIMRSINEVIRRI